MDNVLSGSNESSGNERSDYSGPLDHAKENALKFIFGMQTLSTFKTISDRIELLEALMSLPILQSGSTEDALFAKKQYDREMEELETAIVVFCSLPDAPEA